jgi:hypothetical protein
MGERPAETDEQIELSRKKEGGSKPIRSESCTPPYRTRASNNHIHTSILVSKDNYGLRNLERH